MLVNDYDLDNHAIIPFARRASIMWHSKFHASLQDLESPCYKTPLASMLSHADTEDSAKYTGTRNPNPAGAGRSKPRPALTESSEMTFPLPMRYKRRMAVSLCCDPYSQHVSFRIQLYPLEQAARRETSFLWRCQTSRRADRVLRAG